MKVFSPGLALVFVTVVGLGHSRFVQKRQISDGYGAPQAPVISSGSSTGGGARPSYNAQPSKPSYKPSGGGGGKFNFGLPKLPKPDLSGLFGKLKNPFGSLKLPSLPGKNPSGGYGSPKPTYGNGGGGFKFPKPSLPSLPSLPKPDFSGIKNIFSGIVRAKKGLIGGIVGAKTALLSPVINLVKGIKGGLLSIGGGILQAKGNLIASKGALLASLGESLKGGNGGGSYGPPNVGGGSYGVPETSYGGPRPSGGVSGGVAVPTDGYGVPAAPVVASSGGSDGYGAPSNEGYGPSSAVSPFSGAPSAPSNNFADAEPALDSYGAPQADPISSGSSLIAEDEYGAPQADPISSGSSVSASDEYGAPQADPISSGSSVSASDDYGAPQATPISSGSESNYAASAPVAAADDYSVPQAVVIQADTVVADTYNEPSSYASIPVQDSYGAGSEPVITDNSADSYGSPRSPAPSSYDAPAVPAGYGL